MGFNVDNTIMEEQMDSDEFNISVDQYQDGFDQNIQSIHTNHEYSATIDKSQLINVNANSSSINIDQSINTD